MKKQGLLLKDAFHSWGSASYTGVLALWSTDCRAEQALGLLRQNVAHVYSTHSACPSMRLCSISTWAEQKAVSTFNSIWRETVQFPFHRLAGGEAHFLPPPPTLSWRCSQVLEPNMHRDLDSCFQECLAFEQLLGTNGVLCTLPLPCFLPFLSYSINFTRSGGVQGGRVSCLEGKTVGLTHLKGIFR